MPPERKAGWWVSDHLQVTTGEGQDLFPKPFSLRVLKTTVSASARQQRRALKMPGSFTFRPATYPQNWLEISPQGSKMMENYDITGIWFSFFFRILA